jgi:hypothetical protein
MFMIYKTNQYEHTVYVTFDVFDCHGDRVDVCMQSQYVENEKTSHL